MKNYILNKCIKVYYTERDSDTLIFHLYNRKFKIVGKDIIEMFKQLLNKFLEPCSQSYAIRELNQIYTENTINKAIKFLQDNKIILPYSIEMQKLNKQEYSEYELINYFNGSANIVYDYDINIICGDDIRSFVKIDEVEIISINNINKSFFVNKNKFIIVIFSTNDNNSKRLYNDMIKKGMRVLPIIYETDFISIGPLNIDKYTPCYQCNNETVSNFELYDYSNQLFEPDLSFIVNNINIVVLIAIQELNKVKYGAGNSIVSSIIVYNNYYADIKKHSIIKNYDCDICGS